MASELRLLRVLVVDDDPLVLRSYARTLARKLDVVLASSAHEALKLLATERFDAVIADVAMPDMDGIELYKRATSQSPQISGRFAFVSGGIQRLEVMDFIERSGCPCIEKPVAADALLELVHGMNDPQREKA